MLGAGLARHFSNDLDDFRWVLDGVGRNVIAGEIAQLADVVIDVAELALLLVALVMADAESGDKRVVIVEKRDDLLVERSVPALLAVVRRLFGKTHLRYGRAVLANRRLAPDDIDRVRRFRREHDPHRSRTQTIRASVEADVLGRRGAHAVRQLVMR